MSPVLLALVAAVAGAVIGFVIKYHLSTTTSFPLPRDPTRPPPLPLSVAANSIPVDLVNHIERYLQWKKEQAESDLKKLFSYPNPDEREVPK